MKYNTKLKINLFKKDGTLNDIRIKCFGPDDVIFDKYPDIRNKVDRLCFKINFLLFLKIIHLKIARGNTIFEYTEDGKKKLDLVVYGMKKL